MAVTVIVALAGTWAASCAERIYQEHDSPHIVVDELAGQLLTFWPVPGTWPNLVVGFGWFRLFDSVKPFPAGWIDRNVSGGSGVMLDDIAAAGYAAAVTAAMVHGGVVGWALAKLGLG